MPTAPTLKHVHHQHTSDQHPPAPSTSTPTQHHQSPFPHHTSTSPNTTIYSSASFRYHGRFLFVIVLALPGVLALVGKYSLIILTLGLISMYIFDFLHRRLHSFISFWLTLLLFWTSIYLSHIQRTFLATWEASTFDDASQSLGALQSAITSSFRTHSHSENILTSLNLITASLFIVFCGLYGSLQFIWFKQWVPKLLVLTERYLFEAFPIVCMPLVLATVVSVVGMQNAPFYLVLISCLLVHWFVTPQKSSYLVMRSTQTEFRIGSRDASSEEERTVPDEVRLQDAQNVQVLSALSLVSPLVLYLLLYYRMLEFSLMHVLNCLTLVALPIIFFISRPGKYLWWMSDVSRPHPDAEPTLVWSSPKMQRIRVFALCVCSIIVALFIEYRVIFMRYPHLIALRPPFNYIVVTTGMLIGVGILGLIVNGNLSKQSKLGVILLCTAMTAIASFVIGLYPAFIPIPTLAAYCGTSFYFTKSWKQYYVFAAASSATVFVWLLKSFFFLHYEFDTNFLPVSWSVNLTHVIYLISAFFVLSVVLVPLAIHSSQLVLNGVAFAVHAGLLALMEQLFYDQEEGFYSPSLVFITSALGIVLAQHLFQNERVDANWGSLIMSVYLSKLAVFLNLRMAVIATLLTSFTFTRIYLAYVSKERISKRMAWLYIALSGFFLFLTRRILTARFIEYFIDSQHVSVSRTIGLVILVWGIGILPLTYSFLPNVVPIRKFNITLLIVGSIWAFLQPMLQVSSSEMSMQGVLDHQLSVWEIFVPWIFMAVCVVFLGTSFKVLPMPQSRVGKVMLFVFLGLGSGLSFAGIFLSYCGVLVVGTVCVAFLACAIVIYNAHFPLEKMEHLVGADPAAEPSPFVVSIIAFAIFVVALPTSLLMAKFGTPSPSSVSMGYFSSTEIFESARTSILGVFAVLNFFTAVIIKFKLSGRPLLSNKLTAQQSTVSVPYSDELAAICNIATLQGFVIGVVLTALLRNPLAAYIALVPFLLLLSRDRFALRLWNDSYRYIVVAIAVEMILLVGLVKDMSIILPLFVHTALRLILLKEVVLAVLSVPSFGLLNLFLTQKSPPDVRLALLGLVSSVLAWIFASTESVKASGQIGVAACFLQLFTTQLYRPRDAKREL